jgi:hypothetical protein
MATKIVTQKQLDESGLSLRDFLNKERGLTRKAPEGTKAGVYKSRDNRSPHAPTLVEGTKRTSMARKSDDETMSKSGDTRRIRNMMDSAAEATGTFKDTDYMAESAKSRGVRNMYERGAEEAAKEDGMKRGGKVKGYAKGGVTRADGCITKGHTKGRVL